MKTAAVSGEERRAWRTLLLIAALAAPGHAAAAPDSYVALMAAQVERANVESTIRSLQGFGTRYSFTTGCDDAGDWLLATLQGYGLTVAFEDFTWSGKAMRNVVATLPGQVNPSRVVVVGAHYDSTSEVPNTLAPGADDDASGVAAVLEAARILSRYPFENTIELIGFSGEEQGTRGSQVNANAARSAGKDIVGAVILDMIGYWPATSDRELDIGTNPSSRALASLVEQAALDYASLPVHNWPDTGVCYDDQASYWNVGYPAVLLMDCYEAHKDPGGSGETVPHYHRTTDTIDTLDLDQTTEVVRATVASLALLAVPVIPPITLYAVKELPSQAAALSWTGGAPNFDVRTSPARDFGSGVRLLTPPAGITQPAFSHGGVLGDGETYYYRIGRH